MTIKRPMPGSTTRSLGRISVTIDDLDALLQILTTGHPAQPRKPIVVFVGGWFDYPDDLRKLNEEEMSSLWIPAEDVLVILNDSAALAIGHLEPVNDVYNSWALMRQSKWPSQLVTKRFHGIAPILSTLFMLAAVSFSLIALVRGIASIKDSVFDPSWSAINLMLAVTCVIMGWVISSNPGTGSCYAIIKPRSNEEDREEIRAELIARRAWWVAVASAALAALSMVISLLVGK